MVARSPPASSRMWWNVHIVTQADAEPLAFGSQLLFSAVLPPRQSPTEAPQLFTGSNCIFNPSNIQRSGTKQIVDQP